MDIKICVGSSCHLKESNDVINFVKKAIEENNLSDKVNLKGSFCMGNCGKEGVGVKIDDEMFSVKLDEVSKFFNEEVLGRL